MEQASPRRASIARPFDQMYRDANGLITMCMYCRRTRRNLRSQDHWEFVEAFARSAPQRTSHGICAACLASVEQGLVETSTTLANGSKGNFLLKRVKDKVFQLPGYRKAKKRATSRDLSSIKATILSLAYEFWLEKCDWRSDVDWLIDGRLTDQLDALSRGQLLRVRDLLTWRTVGVQFGVRELTKYPV